MLLLNLVKNDKTIVRAVWAFDGPMELIFASTVNTNVMEVITDNASVFFMSAPVLAAYSWYLL